jgi:hypothetical protein
MRFMLRSYDLVRLRVRDVCHGNVVASRTTVMQQKTQRPVQFEITEHTRELADSAIRPVGGTTGRQTGHERPVERL